MIQRRTGNTTSPFNKESENLPQQVAYLNNSESIAHKLEASELRYRRLFETAQNGILILDAETGEITDVNPFLIDIIGYSKEALLGKKIWELGLFKNTLLAKSAFRELQDKKYIRYEDMPLETKNGLQIAVEFISNVYPINGERVIQCNIRDITDRKHVEEELRDYRDQLEELVKQRTAELEKANRKLQADITERVLAAKALSESYDKLDKALEASIRTIALTVEIRDPYTAGHQRRVANIACAIAGELGLTPEQIAGIRVAGIIHDIGKTCVPSEILSKPGRLSEIEFDMIKMHAQAGHDILKLIEFPWPVAQTVLQHHERMDGSGYPRKLPGKDIILEARIIAVADVVEAMASHRPYRPALGIDKALEEISTNKGKLYDSAVVEACLKVFADKAFKFQ